MQARSQLEAAARDTRPAQSSSVAVHQNAPCECSGVIVIGGAHGSLALARSLGRRGIPVWFFNHGNPITQFSRYVRRTDSWPASAADQIECLLEIGMRNQSHAWTLFPGGDIEVELLSRHHATLGNFFRLTTPAWEVMRWVNDKRLTYRRAADLGIPHPWTFYPAHRDEVAELKGPFPLILKPAMKQPENAFTRAKAWLVKDRRELLARYDQACSLVSPDMIMLQEFVPGSGDSQLSYAALWGERGPVASLVAKRLRQYPIDFGYTSTFVETVDQPEVSRAAEGLLSAINYSGLVEIEFKYDSRERCYKLLDVNGRLWTWNALGGRAGIDFPYLMWLQSQGKPVPECHARTGVRWVHFSRDFIAAMLEIRRGRLSAGSYLRSLRGPSEFAVFALDDPLPAVFELPVLAMRLLHRMRS